MTAPFVDDAILVATDDGPRLVGGRCSACGTSAFPRPGSCPRCGSEQVDEDVLPDRGTLWSWTVQHFPPPVPPYQGPQPFVPYGVGYVELGGRVLVESRLTESDPAQLRIGRELELVLTPLHDADGQERATFAFAPLERP
ncbi:DNA-binding protein [Nitriliruptoraceae bacterium ZYF776]|nr:DNA-binding protein [Profundirhabdus halotolerans]